MTYRQLKRLYLSLAVAAALAVAVAAPSHAQQPPPPQLTINQLDASAYPALRAVVTALDGRGVPVPGLAVAQFQAFDGDTPVVVRDAQNAQDASLRLSVVLAIDVSGSMAGAPLDQAKAAAIDFINALGPNDEASVVVFNQAVTAVVPFTSDRTVLTNGIANLHAAGGTALYEAVQTATYEARLSNASRGAVILLTDGVNEFTDSNATADGSLAVARDAGVPVFTIGFGAAPDTTYLQGLSADTRGQYHAANTANVANVYGDIATLLRNQYVLTLQASAPADGKQADLRLVANIGGAPVEAVATFLRGRPAPAAVATAPLPTPVPAAASSGNDGSGITPLTVFFVSVGVLAAGGVSLVLFNWRRRRRLLLRQLAVTAPNPEQAAAQGVPLPSGAPFADGDSGIRGYLVSLTGERAGARIDLGERPIALGSDPRCEVVLDRSADVAARHATVWIKNGKIMLRNLAGGGRSTSVGGRPVDWVILDDGDEFAIGPHRYRAELMANGVR